MNENLKAFIKTEEYRAIERFFKDEANKIKTGKIDRSKTYQEQGIESHTKELAASAILNVLTKLRVEAEAGKLKFKTYK